LTKLSYRTILEIVIGLKANKTLCRQGEEGNYFPQEPVLLHPARGEVIPFFIEEV
jgi:hypothetical protein